MSLTINRFEKEDLPGTFTRFQFFFFFFYIFYLFIQRSQVHRQCEMEKPARGFLSLHSFDDHALNLDGCLGEQEPVRDGKRTRGDKGLILRQNFSSNKTDST